MTGRVREEEDAYSSATAYACVKATLDVHFHFFSTDMLEFRVFVTGTTVDAVLQLSRSAFHNVVLNVIDVLFSYLSANKSF